MIKFYSILLKSSLFIFILGCFSCSNSDSEKEFTFKVSRSSFLDHVVITGELEPIKTTTISCPNISGDATISYLIPNGSKVKAGDVVCKLQCSNLEDQYSNKSKELAIEKAELEKVKANHQLQLQLLYAQQETIEASVAIQQLDTIQKQFISETKKELLSLNLQMAEIELQQIERKIKSLIKINQSEINKQNLKIKQAENKLKSSKSLLDQLNLKASTDGIALRSKKWGRGPVLVEGDAVWRRMPVVTISNTSEYQIKFNLPEGIYKTINKDNNYQATISSVPNSFLTGFVKQKSPVGKPISKDSKVKFFDVSASVDSLNFEPKPGMTVICKVETQKLDSTIRLPLVAIQKEDTCLYVYKKLDGEFIKQEVKALYKNSSSMVIEKGVDEGDIISIIEPEKSLIKKTQNL